MKRWAILTAFLYALALVLLTAPIIFIAFGDWGKNTSNISFKDVMGIYAQWGYWIWLAVLVIGQILLLFVPIDISQKRLPSRRKLKVPIVVSAFFLANLCFAGIFSVLCAIFTDGAFEIFDLSRIFVPANQPNNDWNVLCTMILSLFVFWLIWLIAFRRVTKSDEPDALVKRTTRWLLRGSILELIIAVPSHVIVRRRDDCCAPVGTFWGIATGISLMLLCFGPGVFYLFAERINKLKPKSSDK